MATKKAIQRFEEWRDDPMSASVLVQRIAEGETLQDLCASLNVPYSLVARHVASTPSLKAEYDTALKFRADALAQETVGIADGVAGAEEGAQVSAAKLRVETRLKLAGKLDRERYGESEAPKVQVNIALGDVAREIAAIETRLGLRAPDAPAVPEMRTIVPAERTIPQPVEAPI